MGFRIRGIRYHANSMKKNRTLLWFMRALMVGVGALPLAAVLPAAWASGTGGNLTVPNPLGGTGDITGLITKIAWWIYDLAFILAFIMLAYGGIQYIISSGEPAKTKKAKETIVNALIGIAIILIGRGFITLVQSIISGPGPTS